LTCNVWILKISTLVLRSLDFDPEIHTWVLMNMNPLGFKI